MTTYVCRTTHLQINHVNHSRFEQYLMFMFIKMTITRWKNHIVAQQVKYFVEGIFHYLIIQQNTIWNKTNSSARQINNTRTNDLLEYIPSTK
jgi:hypothetical protein